MGPQHWVLRAPEISILISSALSPSVLEIFIVSNVLIPVTPRAAQY